MVESGEKWCVVERMWQSGCGAIHEVVRGETAISGDKRVFIMFMGEYSHTIDAKGRLIIPSKFREQLGEEFVLTKGLDGCLSIYPNDEWAAFEEKLRALPLTNKNARTFSRFFVAGATSCELDNVTAIVAVEASWHIPKTASNGRWTKTRKPTRSLWSGKTAAWRSKDNWNAPSSSSRTESLPTSSLPRWTGPEDSKMHPVLGIW